jgi:hypothetical protein
MSRKSIQTKLPVVEEGEGDIISELKESVKILKLNLDRINDYLNQQEEILNEIIQEIKTTRESSKTNRFVILQMLAGRVQSLTDNIVSTLINKQSVKTTFFNQEKKLKKYNGSAAARDDDSDAGVFKETDSSNRCLDCIRNPRQCDDCKETDRIKRSLRIAVVIAKETAAQADREAKAAASAAKSSLARSQSPEHKGWWPFSRKSVKKQDPSHHGGRKYKTRKLKTKIRYNKRSSSHK